MTDTLNAPEPHEGDAQISRMTHTFHADGLGPGEDRGDDDDAPFTGHPSADEQPTSKLQEPLDHTEVKPAEGAIGPPLRTSSRMLERRERLWDRCCSRRFRMRSRPRAAASLPDRYVVFGLRVARKRRILATQSSRWCLRIAAVIFAPLLSAPGVVLDIVGLLVSH